LSDRIFRLQVSFDWPEEKRGKSYCFSPQTTVQEQRCHAPVKKHPTRFVNQPAEFASPLSGGAMGAAAGGGGLQGARKSDLDTKAFAKFL
jgi:hypothetical protein